MKHWKAKETLGLSNTTPMVHPIATLLRIPAKEDSAPTVEDVDIEPKVHPLAIARYHEHSLHIYDEP
jgi:hypothetical protein